MKPAVSVAWLVCPLLAGCTSWTAIRMEPSVVPRAQIWVAGHAIEVRQLTIGVDSLRGSAPGRAATPIYVERSAADSVRVRRFDVLKTVLTGAGFAAGAVTLIGLSVQYGF